MSEPDELDTLTAEIVDLCERLHRDYERLYDLLIEVDVGHGRDALEDLSDRIGVDGEGCSDLLDLYIREGSGGDGGASWTRPPRPMPPDPDLEAERDIDRTMRRIVREQEQLIRDRYGDEAAEAANYGWGEVGPGSLSTKVYVSPCMILTSVAGDDDTIVHDWRRYDDQPEWIREAHALLMEAQQARAAGDETKAQTLLQRARKMISGRGGGEVSHE
jgi:hypothetical protein